MTDLPKRDLTRSNAKFQRAVRRLSRGVSSTCRSWRAERIFHVSHGKTGRTFDIDGNAHVDDRQGYGPAIPGHADDRVDAATMREVQVCGVFALSPEVEPIVAEGATRLAPAADPVCLCNPGTGAVMAALRLARARTGRKSYQRVERGYHGVFDAALCQDIVEDCDPGSYTGAAVMPCRKGNPNTAGHLAHLVPMNPLQRLKDTFRMDGDSLAAMLIEPVEGIRCGIIASLECVPLARRLCDPYGVLLITDEVDSGFRVDRGGIQALMGVKPGLPPVAKTVAKVSNDGTPFHPGPRDCLLCRQARHLPWLPDSARGFDVMVADRTTALFGRSRQGPLAATIPARAGWDVPALQPFHLTRTALGRDEAIISRTRCAGDLGHESWGTPDLALPPWDRLIQADTPLGLRPARRDALNFARVEAGFPIAVMDGIRAHHARREDRARSPFDPGFGWRVDFDMGPLTGRRALPAEGETESRRARGGLDLPGNFAAEGALLSRRKRLDVGRITSAVWPPITRRPIALAEVAARHMQGDDIRVEIHAERERKFAKLMRPVIVAGRPRFTPARMCAIPPERF